ncbi:MAG: hypothetical protein Phog2KO_16560 [Phototrophicaceae bacterium]
MSDLLTFSRKLMRINERVVAKKSASAIFGSIGDLPQAVNSRASLRIGLWSCLSDEHPEIAMGLWVTLAHLLERWRDIEVYRLFVKFGDEPEDFVWTMDKSQVSVEEWDVEYLDENIGIWGKLEQVNDQWQLTATVDNDNLTGEDNEPIDLSISAQNPSDFFAMLPEFANTIADLIEVNPNALDNTDPVYTTTDIQLDANFTDFLDKILDWEVNLLATLWGVEWDDDEILDTFSDLVDAGKAVNSDFSAWVVAKSIAETMRPGYSLIGDLLTDHITKTVETLDNPVVAPILAGAIFNMGLAQNSYRLLRDEVKKRPDSVFAWLKLAEILAEGGLLEQSIDAFQFAIENEAVNSHLYRAYGNTVLLSIRADQILNSYILIDLKEYEQDYMYMAWEAITAYEEALKLDPNNVQARYARILQLAEVDFEQQYLWHDFTELVKNDTTGEYVTDAIDSFYDVNDIQQGVAIFQEQIQANPERLDLYVNLSALYIAGYQDESAIPLLEKAKSMTQDTSQLANIERLSLSASNPDFEYRFAEVVSILDAGNKLNANDVEFLESVVEQAPHVIDAHIALGRSYYYWEETNEALEVLLDAQEAVPNQPSVIDWLGRILWESGERDTAFTYLNKGIAAYPFNVQLLARAGQYLFDNDQLDEARTYLGRAEEIAPRHPMLEEVRAYIARQMADNPTKYDID